jgi:hypothetical protein
MKAKWINRSRTLVRRGFMNEAWQRKTMFFKIFIGKEIKDNHGRKKSS